MPFLYNEMTAAVFPKVAIRSEGLGAPRLVGTPRCGVREWLSTFADMRGQRSALLSV